MVIKLIILSALAGAFSFLMPRICAWFALIYLMPLFYGTLKGYHLTFKHGYLWGLIFFGLHAYAIFMLLYTHIAAPVAIVGYLLLVNYYALLTGITFLIAYTASRRYKAHYYKLGIWIVSLSCLILFLQDYSSCICARVEGLLLLSPLIALAEYPCLLRPLPYIGDAIYLLLLITMQACVIYGVLNKHHRHLMIAGGLCISWLAAAYNITDDGRPMILDRIGYINAPIFKGYPYESVQEVVLKQRALRKAFPKVDIIFMPESTFKFPLNKYPDIPEIVTNNLANSPSIIAGSHCSDNKKGRLNTLILMRQRLITQSYDKQHLMIFGEEIPYTSLLNLKGTSLLNIKEYNWCCGSAENNSNIFHLTPDFGFTCAICSEVYFNSHKPITLPGYPLVVLANDSWVKATPYYQYLLLLLMRYKALLWQQDIIYVCHSGAWWITKKGTLFVLNNLN